MKTENNEWNRLLKQKPKTKNEHLELIKQMILLL